jgi:hypothetical protein
MDPPLYIPVIKNVPAAVILAKDTSAAVTLLPFI